MCCILSTWYLNKEICQIFKITYIWKVHLVQTLLNNNIINNKNILKLYEHFAISLQKLKTTLSKIFHIVSKFQQKKHLSIHWMNHFLPQLAKSDALTSRIQHIVVFCRRFLFLLNLFLKAPNHFWDN